MCQFSITSLVIRVFTIKRLHNLPVKHLLTSLYLRPAVELLAAPPAVALPLLLLWFWPALKVVFHPLHCSLFDIYSTDGDGELTVAKPSHHMISSLLGQARLSSNQPGYVNFQSVHLHLYTLHYMLLKT